MDKTDDKPDDTQTPIWLTRDQVAARARPAPSSRSFKPKAIYTRSSKMA
jgi:hypothetical protein